MKTKKVLLYLLMIFIGATIATAQVNKDKNQMAQTDKSINIPKLIKWNKNVHDFGKIIYAKPVTAVFELTNTGEVPVIITNVKTSCGCTVVNYPKTPIAPGKTANISAIYNARTRGVFNKKIYVQTNVMDNRITLKVTGEVVE